MARTEVDWQAWDGYPEWYEGPDAVAIIDTDSEYDVDRFGNVEPGDRAFWHSLDVVTPGVEEEIFSSLSADELTAAGHEVREVVVSVPVQYGWVTRMVEKRLIVASSSRRPQ